MHRTSRAGDPQLHFHNLIANRVRCVEDGVWRAVDGRHVRAEQKAAGMIGQAAMRAALETNLGVEFGPITKDGQAEILGVPKGLMDFHSKRGRQVKTTGAKLITACEEKLQRSLTPTERAVKYREAAIQTRTAKTKDLEEIEGLGDRWRAEAIEVGHDPAQWLGDVIDRPRTLEQARTITDAELVDQVVDTLTDSLATWGRTHATRELARIVPHQLSTPQAVAERIEALTDQVLTHEFVLGITLNTPTPPGPAAGLVRADGTSQFSRHNTARFTTYYTLEREQGILDHTEQGRNTNHAIAHPYSVDAGIRARQNGDIPLSPDQEAAVLSITTSGDAVSVLVGPAGAGKSATLRTVADIYHADRTPIRGLAPSAKAAAVLREEAGIENSDTLAKLLHEHSHDHGPRPEFQLRRGEVIVLDEASMASTADLHALVELAKEAEAKIVVVGDYRQLGAVDAGGMFRLLANDTSTLDPTSATSNVVELDQVWRFSQPWEKRASLALRDRDTTVIADYQHHGRIHDGSRTELLDHAFTQWSAARADGASVIVTAPDRTTVAEFNQRAQESLQHDGTVARYGRVIGDIEVGVGDEILTLRNDRQLVASDGAAVRNGDRWQIHAHTPDGGLAVQRIGEHAGATATLPPAYLDAGHVDLAYATTVHKAQGVTVDQSLTIIDQRTTAESLYVGATRGRHDNQMLAVTDVELGEFDIDGPPLTGHDVLASALQRDSSERSATEMIREQIEPDLGQRVSTPPPIEPAAPAIPVQDIDPPARPEPERPQPDQQLVQDPAAPAQPERIVGRGSEPMVVEGPSLAKTPQHAPDRELTGDELHALQVRRRVLVDKVRDAKGGLNNVEAAREGDQAKLEKLRDRKTWVQEHDIDGSRERIDQIRHRGVIGQLTTGPRERLEDRKTIAGLEQRITDGYAKLRGLDIRITRQRTAMVQAEQGFDGRGRLEARHRMIIDHNQPHIDTIDRVMDTDVERRTTRILDTLTVEPGLLERRRLVEPPANAPNEIFERWIGVVARAEQYDHTWNNRNPDLNSVEWSARDHHSDGLNTARRGVERALEPYRPRIERPGPDLGLSL